MFAVQSCAVCSKSFDLALYHCPHCHAPVAGATDPGRAPVAPLEAMLDFVDGAVDEAEELRTGMWHALEGTTLEGLRGREVDEIPAGVSVRRVGGEVQVQKLDPSVSIAVDGVEVEDASISLETQVLTVGGVSITEDMVPRDTLELDQLPDFFEPVTIGRSDHCDFHVASGKVSSQHAVLSTARCGLWQRRLQAAGPLGVRACPESTGGARCIFASVGAPTHHYNAS